MEPAVTTNAVRTGQPQPIKSANQAKQGEATMIASDFDTFLRLLTTQLENQDPLNPMESSEFAVQLATFSGVEQQVRTNDLLNRMLTLSSAGGMSDMAGWIGKEARANVPMNFDGTSLDVPAPAIPGADRAMLVVTSEAGDEVGRIDIPNDGKPFTWLGTGNDGRPLPVGSYRFSVDGFVGQTRVSTTPVEVSGTVAEVQFAAAGPTLIMADGSRVPVTDVTSVRASSG